MTRRRSATALVIVAATFGGAIGSGTAGATLRQGGGFGFLIGRSGRLLAAYSIPFTTTGELSVRFHGDRAAGCGRWGLCVYEGQIAASPARNGSILLSRFRRNGRDFYEWGLVLDQVGSGVGLASHTVRLVNGSASGLCADTGQGLFGASARGRTGRLTLRLLQAGGEELGTRCAGPLDADVARAGPQATVSVRRLLAGGGEVRLTGDHRFTSHGFAGTVISTVVLRLGAARRQRLAPRSKRTVRLRTMSERLDLVRIAGGLRYVFHGSGNRTVCQLLDSCGLNGTGTLRPVPARAVGVLSVTALASRPRRDLLAALGLARGGNPRGIPISGFIAWRDRGSLAETDTQSGTCADSTGLQSGFVSLFTQRSVIDATYALPGPLRTRCPGPMLGAGQPLEDVLAQRAVTRSRFTVEVRPESSQLDDGYLISPSGHISVALKRTGHTTQRVFTVSKNLVSLYTHSPR